MNKLNKSISKNKVKDKRLKFQKYFNMGNIFTILSDIWDWICLNAEEIIVTVLSIGFIAVLFFGMICMLVCSYGNESRSGSGVSNKVESSVSIESSAVSNMISNDISNEVVSNK